MSERSENGNNTLDERAKLEIEEEALRRTEDYIRTNTDINTYQDTCCAVTEGKTHFIFGHARKYYKDNPEHQIQEIMAHKGSTTDMGITAFDDDITSTFGTKFSKYVSKQNERVQQYNNVLGNVVPMDIEELTIFKLSESLKDESKKSIKYFYKHEYEKLSEEAKKRYDLANSLKKWGITDTNIILDKWKNMDFSKMSKEEVSFLLDQSIDTDYPICTFREYLGKHNSSLLNELENAGFFAK